MPIVEVPNLRVPDPSAKLWRYVDLAELVTTMRTQRFRFARLDTFVDPWEGMVRTVESRTLRSANSERIVGRHTYVRGELDDPERMNASALCWCRSAFENATFWQRYSPSNLGLAFVTTAGHLRNLLSASARDIYFGDAMYCDLRGMGQTPQDLPRRLFVKDESYSAESEVRAVLHRPGQAVPPEGELLDAPLTTRGFVAAIVLHPLAPAWFGRLVQDVMHDYKKLDFDIRKSDLGGPISAHTLEL